MQCKVSINLKHAIFLGLRPCALVNFGRSASLCTYELWKEGNVPFMDSYAWEREASVRLIFQVYSCRPISGHEVWAGRDRLIYLQSRSLWPYSRSVTTLAVLMHSTLTFGQLAYRGEPRATLLDKSGRDHVFLLAASYFYFVVDLFCGGW